MRGRLRRQQARLPDDFIAELRKEVDAARVTLGLSRAILSQPSGIREGTGSLPLDVAGAG